MRLYKELLPLLALTILCLLTPRLVLSEESEVVHNEAAVRLVDEAWKVCVQASRALRSDLEESSLIFNQYEELYQSAVGLDASIAKTPTRAVSQKVRFCTKVASRIQSASVEPLLVEAVKHCNESRQALSFGRIKNAARAFEQYQQAKEKALLDVSVDQLVATVKSKFNRCNGLAKDLNIAQNDREVYLNSYALVSNQLNGVMKQCESLAVNSKPSEQGLSVDGLKKQRNALKKIVATKVAEGKTTKQWLQTIRKQYPIGHRRLSKQSKKVDTCLARLNNRIRLEEQRVAVGSESSGYEEQAAVLLQDIDETLTKCVLDRELIGGDSDTGRLLKLEDTWKKAGKVQKLGQQVEELQTINGDEDDEFGLPESYKMLNVCIAELLEDIQSQHEVIYSQQIELRSTVDDSSANKPSNNENTRQPTLEELIRDIEPPDQSDFGTL